MIGNRPTLGTGFAGLQQYLLHGRAGASPDRSVWVSTRNLPGGDPEQAAAIMRATAGESQRVERPVYHLSVSLAPGERLERAELERVADRLLRDLGLEEHQALVAEHADGAQQHIHLMVNRVHPDTGRSWSAWRDHQRIEKSLRAQEQELGLKIVPGRNAPVPGLERVEGMRLAKGAFPERVRELTRESFREAKGWQELHAGLKRHGLTLQPSRAGRGLVVTDGRRYVAASKVLREASRPRLEGRLGKFEAASPDLGRLQEVSRQMMMRGRLEAFRGRWLGAMARLDRGLADHEKAASRVVRASGRLDAVLGRAYRQPVAARRGVESDLGRHGGQKVLSTLQQRPGAYGRLQGRVASRARAAAREAARREVPSAVRSYLSAQQAKGLSLQRLAQFRRNPKHPILDSAVRARRVLGRALQRLDKLNRRLEPQKQLQAGAASLARRLGWRAVSRLLPGPAFNALLVAVAIARAPGRILDRGLER